MLPFLNQVEELQAAVRVLLRDRDHEAEVGFDQLLLGLLGLRSPRWMTSIVRRSRSGVSSRSSIICLTCVRRSLSRFCRVLLLFFLQLRRLGLQLRIQKPIEMSASRWTFTTESTASFTSSTRTALDALGELDVANAA
jgi:hypothetical protein